MKIIVGLGNPGNKYQSTRHNVGFKVIDKLARKFGATVWQDKFKAQVAATAVAGEKVILVKPQTYMNLSGESVREVLAWYKIALTELVVVYDDLDLPVGKLRIRYKGRAGGHNGMKSVLQHLSGYGESKEQDFVRVRVGIGRPDEGWQVVDWVLSGFRGDEKEDVELAVADAASAVEDMLREDIKIVMGRYNKK